MCLYGSVIAELLDSGGPMKKLSAAIAVVALALLGLVATSTAAEAYPQSGFSVRLNHQTILEGSTLVVNGSADPACIWTFTFNGTTKTVTGKHVTVRFKAPKVDRKTTFTLTVTCDQVTPSGGGQSAAVRTQTFTKQIPITVLPRGAQASGQAAAGTMPNTGGPSVGLLAGGGALVLGGAAAIALSMRRRRSAA